MGVDHPEPKRSNRRRANRILHADLLSYADRRRDGLYHLLGTGRTVDLSETGLRMLSSDPLPLGKVLSFELKISEGTHRFRGRVVWCDELEADKRYESGIRFQEVDLGLAKSLWEMTGDIGSSDSIKLNDDSGDSHTVLGAQPVEFSPVANRPMSGDGAERELVQHIVGRMPGTDPAPAPLEELLRRALANGPQGGYTSPGELRDALARAAAALAEKVEKEMERSRPPSDEAPVIDTSDGASAAPAAAGPPAASGSPTPSGGVPAVTSAPVTAGPATPAQGVSVAIGGPLTPARGIPHVQFGGPPTPARGVPSVKAGRVTPPPRPGGMAGHFKGDQLIEFVQMLGLTRRTGMLEVVNKRLSGHLAFRDGRFVAATASDGSKGEPAIYAMLLLPKGDFRFRPDHLTNIAVETDLAVEGVIFEVARRRDEAGAHDDSQEKPV